MLYNVNFSIVSQVNRALVLLSSSLLPPRPPLRRIVPLDRQEADVLEQPHAAHIHLFHFAPRGSPGRPVSHRQGRGWRGGFLLAAAEGYCKIELVKWFRVRRPSLLRSSSSILSPRRRGTSADELSTRTSFRPQVIRDLELMPELAGQNWSGVFLQKFEGSVTIWPKSRCASTVLLSLSLLAVCEQ